MNKQATGRLATIEELIEDARNGRMFILVDDEDRENEGDIVIPAQMATPETVNFMAKNGRGLICLALTARRIETLGLPMMAQDNRSRNQTAFTVSIEAREGISTGISAADRARSIQVAIDSATTADDIVSPGHVFPLMARDGGVLVRAGHTEASVDIARLAGLNPSAVICEVMKDDGTMARLPDLMDFAAQHKLKVGTIRDLIAYRRRHDNLVKQISEMPIRSEHGGDWRLKVYGTKVDYAEHLVLQKGDISPARPTLVRMHAFHVLDDIVREDNGRAGQLWRAMDMIGKAGAGIVVVIRDTRPTRLSELVAARKGETPKAKPDGSALRDYGIGAQILYDLGVRDMVLLSNTPHHVVGLEGYGLNITDQKPITS